MKSIGFSWNVRILSKHLHDQIADKVQKIGQGIKIQICLNADKVFEGEMEKITFANANCERQMEE
jgi:hypothetical protein